MKIRFGLLWFVLAVSVICLAIHGISLFLYDDAKLVCGPLRSTDTLLQNFSETAGPNRNADFIFEFAFYSQDSVCIAKGQAVGEFKYNRFLGRNINSRNIGNISSLVLNIPYRPKKFFWISKTDPLHIFEDHFLVVERYPTESEVNKFKNRKRHWKGKRDVKN